MAQSALIFFTINMGAMPVNSVVVVMTLVFVTYSLTGGLVVTARTDFLQGFLILALSFMLIPLGWGLAGGIGGMKQALGPDKFSLGTPCGTVCFIAILTLNGLIVIIA